MRFIHAADIHLGYQQYGFKDRFNDFSEVFLYIVDQALEQEVDFMLLAGDLFHKRTVAPLAMRVAIEGLKRLKEAEIPVLSVEGNHEAAYYRDQYSWMEFLDAMDYVYLLNPRFEKGDAILSPHSDAGGAYVDLPEGIRVYGLKYYGASTGKAVQSFAESLSELETDRVSYSILMMHAGLEGQLAHTGRLKLDHIAPLKEQIDYLALGHIHKPYTVGGWLYNPGSPETCGMDEVAWPERGYYLVEIDSGDNPRHNAELLTPPRRPFHRLRLEVDALTTPNKVYDAVRRLIRRENKKVQSEPAPVVELMLAGVLPFNRYELELDYVRGLLEEAWSPLTARVQSKITPADFDVDLDIDSSRPVLEINVLRELFERDNRFREHAEAWAEGAVDLKRMVLEDADPRAVVEHLQELSSTLPFDFKGQGEKEVA